MGNIKEQMMQTLLDKQEQLTIVVFSVEDKHHRYSFFNKGAEELSGYSKMEVIGQPITLLHDNEEAENIEMLLKGILETGTGTKLTTEIIQKSGEKIPVELILEPIIDEKEEVSGILGMATNILIRTEIQKKLLTSEEKFRTLFEKSDDALLILDGENFTEFNPSVLRMLGATRQEVLESKPWDLSPEYQEDGQKSMEKAPLMIKKALDEGSHRFEWLHKKMNGDIIPVEVTLTPLTLGKQSVLYTVWRDISQQKKLEKDLRGAKTKAEESDRLKSAFVANMSHEIRTPMNSILGFAELLSEDSITKPEKDRYVEIIRSSGNQLLSIISDVVDISKIEARQMELNPTESNLDELFVELFHQYSLIIQNHPKKNIELKRVCDPHVCCQDTVWIDGNRFKQIMINLIDNAIKFTNKGEIVFGCRPGKTGFIEVYVRDTGIGIPQNMLNKVFERFYQNKENRKVISGTGLGLSISKSLVEMMQGSIRVESVENIGSEFAFSLPLNSQH